MNVRIVITISIRTSQHLFEVIDIFELINSITRIINHKQIIVICSRRTIWASDWFNRYRLKMHSVITEVIDDIVYSISSSKSSYGSIIYFYVFTFKCFRVNKSNSITLPCTKCTYKELSSHDIYYHRN